MEPLAFLRRHPPFDRLGHAALERIGAALEIAYHPADARILQRGGPVSAFLYVVRKGSVRLERDGQTVQVIEDGECFGVPSLIGRASPHVDAIAAEDTLLYQVPAAVFDSLMEIAPFARFFLVDLSERLRQSAALKPLPIGGGLATPVGQLSSRPPAWVDPSITVGEAARVMRDAGISSLLVLGDSPGIVTDRDLRTRVLAEGRGADTRVGDVTTRPLRTIAASATLLETLVFMLEHRVHHAPLEVDGTIAGVITDTDLLRLQLKSPLSLLRNIDRLEIPTGLPRYAHDVAAMVEALHWSGLDAARIGPVVSHLNDALVGRLLRHAEHELGPPPCPYAWIVFGSEGRMEQTLLTDQDNALVHADDNEAARAYFAALAARVVDLLDVAAFPPCPGGFMASQWCHPLDWWVATFRGWLEKPEPRALMEAMNVFDFRAVHGSLSLEPLEHLLLTAGREKLFLAHLARASMGLTPPIGAFRQIKREDGGVDVKKGGLTPIVGLARVWALDAGCTARSTLERVEAAARAGTLSPAGAATLTEAFRFLLELRLREQLRALRAGEPLGHKALLEHLTTLEQGHLKDVFLAIREHQQAAALRYATERLA